MTKSKNIVLYSSKERPRWLNWTEQRSSEPWIGGSSPSRGTLFFDFYLKKGYNTNMKKYFLILFLISIPTVAMGQGLVPCSGVNCRLCDLFTLIADLTSFLLGTIVPPAAALVFIWGGVKFYTAMGDGSKINEAKTILKNVLIGLVIVYGAHFFVTTLLCTVGYAECESWYKIDDFCDSP